MPAAAFARWEGMALYKDKIREIKHCLDGPATKLALAGWLGRLNNVCQE